MPTEINIAVNELGNIGQYDGYFNLTADFDGKRLPEIRNNVFEMCCCAPNDTLNTIWQLKFSNISDEEIYKLSTKPIIITLQTFPSPENGEKELPLNFDDLKVIGFFPIYLSKMLSVKMVNLTGTQAISLQEKPTYTEMMTWTNTPYICYDITSIEPLLDELPPENPSEENISVPIIDIPLVNLSLTFECIINMKNEYLDNYTYEIAIKFPLENSLKVINLPNGKVCSVNKMDYYKTYNNLINYPGDLKYSTIPTNLKFDNINDFEIPNNCNLNPDSMLSDKIISFQQLIELKITKEMFERFIDSNNITIEVLLTPTENNDNRSAVQQHFIGVIEVSKFKLVGIENIRYIVPLIKFEYAILTLYPPNEQIFYPKFGGKLPSAPLKKKSNQKAASVTKPEPVKDFEYIFNEKNFTTCVIVHIEVDQSYLPRLKETFMGNECRILELRPKFDDNIIDLNVKNILNDFIENCEYVPCNETVECKQHVTKIYSMFNKITMNYSWNLNSQDRAKDLLEDIYIKLTNKIHDAFNDGISDLMSNSPKYRLKCAIECLELGFNDEAQDLYIQNINDTNEPADFYVDYAIHNLFLCDMAMVKVCCDEAIKSNPKTYSAYLLLAYAKFFVKDYIAAEEILLHLTGMCNNFAEAWMALLILYLSEDRKSQINSVLIQLNRFIPNDTIKIMENYICHLHHRKELLWKPDSVEYLKDPKLTAIRYFIQWGCLQFAEVGLGFIIHRYGFDSYEYLYHMALVDYYRKDYSSALQRCTSIRCINPNITMDKKNLIVHCLLEMQSLNAIYELKRNKTSKDKLCKNYLMHMKIGRMYMNTRKYRTAIYYWKQCCYSEATYCGFKLLGLVTLKCQQLDLSEICFQMAYKINPFNCISWGNLAIINFRKKRTEQFKIYAENAKNQPILDKKLLEIIEKIEEILEQQVK